LVDSKKNGKNENGSRLREVLSNFDKNKITKREREKEEGQFVFRKVRGVYKFGRRKSGITKKEENHFGDVSCLSVSNIHIFRQKDIGIARYFERTKSESTTTTSSLKESDQTNLPVSQTAYVPSLSESMCTKSGNTTTIARSLRREMSSEMSLKKSDETNLPRSQTANVPSFSECMHVKTENTATITPSLQELSSEMSLKESDQTNLPGTVFSRTRFGYLKHMEKDFVKADVRQYWFNMLSTPMVVPAEKEKCVLRSSSSSSSSSRFRLRISSMRRIEHSFVVKSGVGRSGGKSGSVLDRVNGKALSFEHGGRHITTSMIAAMKKEQKMQRMLQTKMRKKQRRMKQRQEKQEKRRKNKTGAALKPGVIRVKRKYTKRKYKKKDGGVSSPKKRRKGPGRPMKEESENLYATARSVFDEPDVARDAINYAVAMGYKGSYMDVRDGRLLLKMRDLSSGSVEMDPMSQRRNLINPDRGHVTDHCNARVAKRPRTSVSDNLLLLAFTAS